MPSREYAEAQLAVETPADRRDDREPSAGSTARAWEWRALLRSPILLAIAACIALAALSAALLPTVPSYDPWAWIVWGREVVDPHLSFATGGGPSWKPLPVIFTTIFGLFGGAAPTLWVITARVGGLLALVAAWRLASRLVRPLESPISVPIAGVVAVLGILLTQDYLYYMYRGTSEPMLVATILWSVDRLLARKHAQAFTIAVAASLIRPEAWPFLAVYVLWLWRKQPQLRLLIIAGIAAIPFFWFVPPWIGSGQPFLAASHAKDYNGHLGSHPSLEALRRSYDLQILPVILGAVVALALTLWRERDRVLLALAAGAVAWIVLVIAMVIDGYPGLERFFLGSAAMASVLAGVGFARVAVLAGSWIGTRLRGSASGGGAGRIATLGVAAVLIAVSIPLATSRINSARAQRRLAQNAVNTLNQLSAAVRAAGGHDGVYPCRSSFAAVNHGVQTALAWKLHVTLGRVGTAMRHQGVDFIGPHNATDGAPAAISAKLTARELVAQVGAWTVLRVTAPGHANHCVGR